MACELITKCPFIPAKQLFRIELDNYSLGSLIINKILTHIAIKIRTTNASEVFANLIAKTRLPI